MADDAIEQAIKVLSPSTLTPQQMASELKWFQQAAAPFKGKSISVVSEDIPTHRWEKQVLAKLFEDITGIKIHFDIVGEGTVVENIFKQINQGVHLYDVYINDADHIGTHSRIQGVVNLTQYMKKEGKAFTNPKLDLDDFLNLQFGQDYDGQQLQLPDQQFANLYWFRYDWFTRKDIQALFLTFTEKKYGKGKSYTLGVPENWAAYEDIAEFFTNTPIDGKKVYGHTDFGKKSPSLGWRFTDAWLSIAGAGDIGLPNGAPVDEWGIRVKNRIPVGSSVERGGATNSPAAIYALQSYIDWLNKYSPPSARQGTFRDNNITAAKGNVAQQIFLYSLWINNPAFHQGEMVNEKGEPVWRLAPTPHGRYWKNGMKVGYQDAGSWTIPKDTRGPKRAVAWLWAQFCVSKSAAIAKFKAGGTPVRHSTLASDYVQKNKSRWGGLIEFYQSNAIHLWTDTGLNVPHYPLLFRAWWPNLDLAINGQITAKQAMDNIAYEQDKIMGNLKLSRDTPKLNPKKSQAYWLAQPGAPKPSMQREKPKTLTYEAAIKIWRKASP
ncbi:MAG: carbohydrate ABC transporter substrate-binding protein [Gammaproteobacteria bacterium]|nr:carbohydrate ABC transporter substrate-binding protein [Gammaproteobacteria bacterium]